MFSYIEESIKKNYLFFHNDYNDQNIHRPYNVCIAFQNLFYCRPLVIIYNHLSYVPPYIILSVIITSLVSFTTSLVSP